MLQKIELGVREVKSCGHGQKLVGGKSWIQRREVDVTKLLGLQEHESWGTRGRKGDGTKEVLECMRWREL